MLSESEYEEFRCVIRGSKYLPNDFEISTVDYVDKCQHLYDGFTRILVRYMPTNISKTYLAGFASFWLRTLEQDINRGVFDSPTKERPTPG